MSNLPAIQIDNNLIQDLFPTKQFHSNRYSQINKTINNFESFNNNKCFSLKYSSNLYLPNLDNNIHYGLSQMSLVVQIPSMIYLNQFKAESLIFIDQLNNNSKLIESFDPNYGIWINHSVLLI